jgi:hypothetical protein
MKSKSPRFWTLIVLAGAVLAPALSMAQENSYSLIAGTYELDTGSRTLTFKIVLKEAKLYFDALIQGQEPQVMTLVPGQSLTFSSVDPNGDDIVLAFDKDALGRIPGCTITLPARNIETKAVKIEKK